MAAPITCFPCRYEWQPLDGYRRVGSTVLIQVTALLEELARPEYVHVLLNPLPVYGLATAALALAGALAFRSRPALVAALALVAIMAASAWPVYVYGRQAYEVVNTTVDPGGQDWLNAHQHRAEKLIWTFYALAALAAVGIAAPVRWPKTLVPLAALTLLGALIVLGAGGWIAYAGGKVRHIEFRRGVPPPD